MEIIAVDDGKVYRVQVKLLFGTNGRGLSTQQFSRYETLPRSLAGVAFTASAGIELAVREGSE